MYSNNWEEKKISELIEEFVRGISYSSEDISNPSGIPMMNLASIDKAGYYREGEMKFYSGRYSEANKVHSGEMLIACTDLTRDANIIGTPIKVPYGDDFYLFTMDLAKLTPRSELIDADFIYYALKTSTYRRYIKPWASGTNVLHLNLKGVYDYKLKFPKDISAQKSIASLLSNIDRKIALNRQINDNLEAMAKQLYDYWFVQFDFPNEEGKPYKSSGGKMVWNDKLKREIPEGWADGVFSDIANITMGQSPDGSSYNEDGNGTIFYQGSTDFGIRFPSIRMYTTAPSRFAKQGDILMSVRAPVGAVNIANTDCCIGRGLSAINSKIGSITYTYFVIHYLKVRFDNVNSVGTTFGSITKEELYNLPVVVPSAECIKKFESISKPIFDKQMIVGLEIQSLTKQRDELLPLLMNGQVSVNYHLSDD